MMALTTVDSSVAGVRPKAGRLGTIKRSAPAARSRLSCASKLLASLLVCATALAAPPVAEASTAAGMSLPPVQTKCQAALSAWPLRDDR